MRSARRDCLRSALSGAHGEAERVAARRVDVTTVAGYRHFLLASHGTLRTFGPALDRSSTLSGIPARSGELLAALHRDLRSLAGHATIVPLPIRGPARSRAGQTGDAFVAGVGYALEGMAQFAALLVRQVPDDAPTRYLDAMVGARYRRWLQYSRWLDGPGPEGLSMDEMIEGASAVFEAMRQALEPALPRPAGFGRATTRFVPGLSRR